MRRGLREGRRDVAKAIVAGVRAALASDKPDQALVPAAEAAVAAIKHVITASELPPDAPAATKPEGEHAPLAGPTGALLDAIGFERKKSHWIGAS